MTCFIDSNTCKSTPIAPTQQCECFIAITEIRRCGNMMTWNNHLTPQGRVSQKLRSPLLSQLPRPSYVSQFASFFLLVSFSRGPFNDSLFILLLAFFRFYANVDKSGKKLTTLNIYVTWLCVLLVGKRSGKKWSTIKTTLVYFNNLFLYFCSNICL